MLSKRVPSIAQIFATAMASRSVCRTPLIIAIALQMMPIAGWVKPQVYRRLALMKAP
jgi:hypothetical protein